jgi:biopolymer transport protein TolR
MTYVDSDADGDDAITGINITPFVDVVLVLLVIFMLTAKLIVARGVDGIAQPSAATGTELRAGVRLSVTRDGALFVGPTAVTSDADAIERVRAALAQAPTRRVLVRGDSATAYGGVMRAIDVARAAGAESVALENVKP